MLDKKYLNLLVENLLSRRNTTVYLCLTLIKIFPKCIIKFLIQNYLHSVVETKPTSEFLIFKRFKKNSASSYSEKRDEIHKIVYYAQDHNIFCNKSTYDFEALIISPFNKKIYLDSNFSADDTFFIATIKNQSRFSKIFIRNVLEFYLNLQHDKVSYFYSSDIKNFEFPIMNYDLQNLFNGLCKKYNIADISKNVYLKQVIIDSELRIKQEQKLISKSKTKLLEINF